MKKWISILSVLIILTTGCQTKGLLNYQEAVETTNKIKTGKMIIEVDMTNTFNEEGLSQSEIKDLSMAKNSYTKVSATFDERNPDHLKEQIHIYYLFGGMGLDSWVYIDGEELTLKVPIIDVYMDISEQPDIEDENTNISDVSFDIDIDTIMKKWLSVFEEENVVVGKDEYVITSKGQVKTTAYTFYISKSQIDQLYDDLINDVDIEELEKVFEAYAESYIESDDVTINLAEVLEHITIHEVTGTANVDFDNRLIQQTFNILGEYKENKPGDIDEISLEIKMRYEDLGKDVQIKYPVLTEDNTVTPDELNDLFDDMNN